MLHPQIARGRARYHGPGACAWGSAGQAGRPGIWCLSLVLKEGSCGSVFLAEGTARLSTSHWASVRRSESGLGGGRARSRAREALEQAGLGRQGRKVLLQEHGGGGAAGLD